MSVIATRRVASGLCRREARSPTDPLKTVYNIMIMISEPRTAHKSTKLVNPNHTCRDVLNKKKRRVGTRVMNPNLRLPEVCKE
jgi:hypothetical protein